MLSSIRILLVSSLTLANVFVASDAYGQGSTPTPIVQLEPAKLSPPSALTIDLPSIRVQTSGAAQEKSAQNPQPPDQQKKQLELLQKQIEAQQKMIELLADQVKKQGAASAPFEKLQAQSAVLEGRSIRAAQRDQELAGAIDDLRETIDAHERTGPNLPDNLKKLFLPSNTNETPLSIYGALAFGYSKMVGNAGTAFNGAGRPDPASGFAFGEFTPDFLLKLDDWIFLEAEIGIGSDGSVAAGSFAQADFFVNDWLTIIAGHFVAPIGWYNERLNNPWINKLPADFGGAGPLLWQQVLPPMALLGVEAQGAFYLGNSPLKMEYAAYLSNGLNLTPAGATPNINELANLENMEDTFSVIRSGKILGGRLGLWWPEMGLEAGLSGMHNGAYIAGSFPERINLWAVDFNYRQGNWDVRAEYGMTFQQAAEFIGTNITRSGVHFQVAYRARDLPDCFWQKLEFIYRYGYVNFKGIDPNALDITTFDTPMDVPIRRQQNEFGIDYWFSPRLVWKFAYQINDEPNFHLHDNQFITELAWGW
jgi:hypothetical protein